MAILIDDEMFGKRVLITGSSSGIGEQLAYRYAKLGSSIMLAARRGHLLQKVAKHCKELSPNNATVSYLATDLSKMENTLLLIEQTEIILGAIDVLVINHVAPIEFGFWSGSRTNLTTLDEYIDVNFKSYVHLTSHALKLLTKNEGRIIVVSSVAGKIGTPFQHSYAAAKFALDGFFTSLRIQFQFTRVRTSVTLCIIGGVETDMLNTAMDKFNTTRAMKWFPLENPVDVSRAIVTAGL
ncbi:hydroxysteroid 11-beta-dehydrogenase 1-like protein B [Tubulanus polymorphus]|uniref:hydroxysteroid 11-beta-dehydrogenase 1-like protein B n=1 Tax=Tubulanus polymorphus TaxID=672921 RepID=UPI003DA37405